MIIKEVIPMSNRLLLRTLAITIHIFLNFFLVTWLMKFDLTGSWINFFLFIIAIALLIVFFVMHLLSFIMFIKTRS